MRMFLVGMCDVFLLLYLTALSQMQEQPVSRLTVKDYRVLEERHKQIEQQTREREEELSRKERERQELAARLRSAEEQAQDLQRKTEEFDRLKEQERKELERLRTEAAAREALSEEQRRRLEELEQTASEQKQLAEEGRRQAEESAARAAAAEEQALRTREAAEQAKRERELAEREREAALVKAAEQERSAAEAAQKMHTAQEQASQTREAAEQAKRERELAEQERQAALAKAAEQERAAAEAAEKMRAAEERAAQAEQAAALAARAEADAKLQASIATTRAQVRTSEAERLRSEAEIRAIEAERTALNETRNREAAVKQVRSVTQSVKEAYQTNVTSNVVQLNLRTVERGIISDSKVDRKFSAVLADFNGETAAFLPLDQAGLEMAGDLESLNITADGRPISKLYVSGSKPRIVALILTDERQQSAPVLPRTGNIADYMPTLIAVRNGARMTFGDRMRDLSSEYYFFQRDRLAWDAGRRLLKFQTSGFRGTGDYGERLVRGDQIVDLDGRYLGIVIDDNTVLPISAVSGWRAFSLTTGKEALNALSRELQTKGR